MGTSTWGLQPIRSEFWSLKQFFSLAPLIPGLENKIQVLKSSFKNPYHLGPGPSPSFISCSVPSLRPCQDQCLECPKVFIVHSFLPFRPVSGFAARSLGFCVVLSGFLPTLPVVYSIVSSPGPGASLTSPLLPGRTQHSSMVRRLIFGKLSVFPTFKMKRNPGFDLGTRFPHTANADLVPPPSASARPTDFDFLKVIGKGNYGKVSDTVKLGGPVSPSPASSVPLLLVASRVQRGSSWPAGSRTQSGAGGRQGSRHPWGLASVLPLRCCWPSASPTGRSTQ